LQFRAKDASKQKALVRLKLRQIEDQGLNSQTLVEQALMQKKNPRGSLRAG
jgi:hypothetical protein